MTTIQDRNIHAAKVEAQRMSNEQLANMLAKQTYGNSWLAHAVRSEAAYRLTQLAKIGPS
jgi:hypothetical protein